MCVWLFVVFLVPTIRLAVHRLAVHWLAVHWLWPVCPVRLADTTVGCVRLFCAAVSQSPPNEGLLVRTDGKLYVDQFIRRSTVYRRLLFGIVHVFSVC